MESTNLPILGLTIKEIQGSVDEDKLIFITTCGRTFKMYHAQDCCESVTIEDIEGDLNDLIGSPLTIAEEVGNREQQALQLIVPLPDKSADTDSGETWTYYRLATTKGFVIIRWFGTSNGYYSETADFREITTNH